MSAERIEKTGVIQISWDAPRPLSHYRVYYREAGTTDDWIYYGDAQPATTVVYELNLPLGEWEIAIRWVDDLNQESPLHGSTDATAILPQGTPGGWYVAIEE